MPSYLREITSEKVAEFNVPFNGTWNVAANQIGATSLYDSLNVFIRKRKLLTRPGLRPFKPTIFDSNILGGKLAIPATGKMLLACSQRNLYKLTEHDDEWAIPLGCEDVFDLEIGDIINMCFMETNNNYIGFIADGHTPIKQWIDGVGVTQIAPTVGTVPIAKSVCIAARRLVALVYPHTLRWTATLDHTSWSSLSINKIGSTTDEGICILPIGTLDFVFYKEHSIHLAKAQAGSDANAFAIKFSQETDGPAGIDAVAELLGAHMYMTDNGRIGLFDGQSLVRWIADGLWFYLQDDIDPSFSYKILGVYDHRLHTAVFYYPKRGDHGLLKGMVLIQVPLEGSGVDTYPSFLGISSIPVSYGYRQRFNNTVQRSVIFSSTENDVQSFIFDETYDRDDDIIFPCHIQTGLQAMPDLKEYMVNLEIFLERAVGNGSVNIHPVTSHLLESEGGYIGLPQTIDLNNDPVGEHVGFNVSTRFFGFKLNWNSDSEIKYAGAIGYGRLT